jgi:hypothetical protein
MVLAQVVFVGFGLAGAGICSHFAIRALRKGYVRGSRSMGHDHIYRHEQPEFYWTSVVVNVGMTVLCLALVGLALLSPGSFR